MPGQDVVWNPEQGGNVDHIAENGLSILEVEYVILNAQQYDTSQTTGRPLLFGHTETGDHVCVVYEQIDDITIYPVTAFILED